MAVSGHHYSNALPVRRKVQDAETVMARNERAAVDRSRNATGVERSSPRYDRSIASSLAFLFRKATAAMARQPIWNFHNPQLSLAQSCLRELIGRSRRRRTGNPGRG